MKLTLISPYPDITSFGVRTLSAHLRKHGHNTQLIFLPDPFGDNLKAGVARYKDSVLDQVVSLCAESDLIGVTLMTNFFEGAVQITSRIKDRLGKPVIWGGVHPTIRPDESIRHADIICIGEGEDSLLQLMDRMSAGEDFTTIKNLWVKTQRGVVRNELSPLPADLDRFPSPDYSGQDHHVLIDDAVVPLTHDTLSRLLAKGTVSSYLGRTGYQTMTSRGCPYSCAYCINDTVNKMYGGKGKLRWRSVSHVMDELLWVRRNMPYVDYVWFSDDEFMSRRAETLEEFCREYKEKINLPFSCLVSPLSVTEEKIGMLVDAGLVYVQMGVESGSARMQELYNRKNMTNARMLKAMHIINRFKDRMAAPSYDFLVDVPYETDLDRVESLKLVAEIPKPFRLQPFTLILYPGTKLYEIAKERGILEDELKEIYNKTYVMRKPDYLNFLLMLARNGKFPSVLLKIFISALALKLFNSEPMKPCFRLLYLGAQSVHHVVKRVGARS